MQSKNTLIFMLILIFKKQRKLASMKHQVCDRYFVIHCLLNAHYLFLEQFSVFLIWKN